MTMAVYHSKASPAQLENFRRQAQLDGKSWGGFPTLNLERKQEKLQVGFTLYKETDLSPGESAKIAYNSNPGPTSYLLRNALLEQCLYKLRTVYHPAYSCVKKGNEDLFLIRNLSRYLVDRTIAKLTFFTQMTQKYFCLVLTSS